MPNDQKRYSFPADLTQAIVSILESLPYGQVANVMGGIVAEVNAQNAPQQMPALPDVPNA